MEETYKKESKDREVDPFLKVKFLIGSLRYALE